MLVDTSVLYDVLASVGMRIGGLLCCKLVAGRKW